MHEIRVTSERRRARVDQEAAIPVGAPQRLMLVTGEPADTRDPAHTRAWGLMEYFGLAFHGFTVTHLDALSHGT